MQITTLGVRSTLWIAICLLAVSACVYEIPIQQGNYLDATALVQVKKGMTRAQVRYLLGTPMVPGGFDNDRWDYDYYLKLRQQKHPRIARAAVYFHNDLVDHVDSDVMPVASDAAVSAPPATPGSPPSAPAGEPPSPPVGPAVANAGQPRGGAAAERGGRRTTRDLRAARRAHPLTTPVARIRAQRPVYLNAVTVAWHEIPVAAHAPYARGSALPVDVRARPGRLQLAAPLQECRGNVGLGRE